jgi:hypothetical protein
LDPSVDCKQPSVKARLVPSTALAASKPTVSSIVTKS